jgi:hypothetical protein
MVLLVGRVPHLEPLLGRARRLQVVVLFAKHLVMPRECSALRERVVLDVDPLVLRLLPGDCSGAAAATASALGGSIRS